MNWQMVAVPSIYVATALVGLLAALFAWRRRTTPGASALCGLMVAAAFWAFADGVESAVADLDTKILISKFSYLGIHALPVLFLLFAVHYTGRRTLITTGRLLWLWLIPALTVVMVFTNDWHRLVWPAVTLATLPSGVDAVYAHGPWFWFFTIYCYALIFAGSLLLALSAFYYRGLYRHQAIFLLIATVVPILANQLYLSSHNPLPGVDWTPVAFVVSGTLVSWAIFRLQLFDIGPIARNTLFEKMGDALLVLDRHARLADANPAALAMFGGSAQLIGQPLEQIIDSATAAELLPGDGRDVRSEVALGGPPPRYLDALCTTLLDARGQPSGRLIVLRDITERIQMEEDLRRSEQHYRSFLATMSHELRTPLTGIMGLAEALQTGVYGPITERQARSLHLIEESGRHLAGVINDLLDLSKIQAGKIELVRQRCAVCDLCRTSVDMVKLDAERKQQKLICDIAPDDLVIEVDVRRMQQVLINLLGNACKFTPEGKAIGVTVRHVPLQHAVSITVWDEGIGIAPEDIPKLFQPFVQLDNRLSRQYGGTGLGLVLVRSLVELHGGTVTVASEVGAGSRFTILLPQAGLCAAGDNGDIKHDASR